MKTILRNGINIILLVFGKSLLLNAQMDLSKVELGLNMGSFIYTGDLTPSAAGSTKTPGFCLGVFANRILSRSFSLRTNLAIGKLRGDDAKYSFPEWRQQRNFNFSSPAVELSELLVWDVLGKNNTQENSHGLSPNLFGGAGYTFLKIRRDWSNFNSEYFSTEPTLQAGLTVDAAQSPPKGIFVLPVGMGIKLPVSQKIALSAETSYRFTFTDYLDGFSHAANPDKKDYYYNYSVGLVYKLGVKNRLNCPVIRN